MFPISPATREFGAPDKEQTYGLERTIPGQMSTRGCERLTRVCRATPFRFAVLPPSPSPPSPSRIRSHTRMQRRLSETSSDSETVIPFVCSLRREMKQRAYPEHCDGLLVLCSCILLGWSLPLLNPPLRLFSRSDEEGWSLRAKQCLAEEEGSSSLVKTI